MKCFYVTESDVIPGLSIKNEDGRPYVLLGRTVQHQNNFGDVWVQEYGKRAWLSNELLEGAADAGGMRVLFCRPGVVTNDSLMLRLENDDTKGSCLVLVNIRAYGDFTIVKGIGEVLLSANTGFPCYVGWDSGQAALVVLKPDAELLISKKRNEKIPGTGPTLRNWFRPSQYRECVDTILRIAVDTTGTAVSVKTE